MRYYHPPVQLNPMLYDWRHIFYWLLHCWLIKEYLLSEHIRLYNSSCMHEVLSNWLSHHFCRLTKLPTSKASSNSPSSLFTLPSLEPSTLVTRLSSHLTPPFLGLRLLMTQHHHSDFLLTPTLVSQARPTSAIEGKGLVNCVDNPCPTGMQLAGWHNQISNNAVLNYPLRSKHAPWQV